MENTKKTIKRNISLVLVIGLGLLYIHLTIGPAIAAGLLVIWYAALGLGGLAALTKVALGIRRILSAWQISIAEVEAAQAEARKQRIDIRSFKRGEQVYQIGAGADTIHALHLEARSYSNGKAKAPTDHDLKIFQIFNTVNNNFSGSDGGPQANIIDMPALEAPQANSGNWIENIILPAPHIHICGPTQSGKTTLGSMIIDHLRPTGAEFYLVNPKHVEYRQSWPITPFCKSIDGALDACQAIAKRLTTRIADQSYDPDTANEVVIIIDEWDWIYEVYGSKAINTIRQLTKVGAELKFKVILVGQSPLSQDTGLSGSDYDNMVRVAIWAAGEKLIRAWSINPSDKAPYRARITELKRQAQGDQQLRYAVVVPLWGDPSVQIIPHLTPTLQPGVQPTAPQLTPPLQPEAQPTEQEQRIIDAWDQHRSFPKMHKKLTGASKPGGTDYTGYKATLAKFGVKWTP